MTCWMPEALLSAAAFVGLAVSPVLGGAPQSLDPGSDLAWVKTIRGPQIFVPDTSDRTTLDMNDNLRHKPSGFACPQTFDGLAVLLMSIEPDKDSLICDYRAGTDVRYNANDPVRYRLALRKTHPGQTARDLFATMVADGRAALKITGNHTPPWANGPSAPPEWVVFWDTDGDGVQGIWMTQIGGWIVYLRAQYAPSAATDVEAGRIAQTLFAQIKQQVK